MTFAGLVLRNRHEYEQATEAEVMLRIAIEKMASWLYDASELGTLIDDLNRARSDYERAHPDEARLEAVFA